MHTSVRTAKAYDLPRGSQARAVEVQGQFKHALVKPLISSVTGTARFAKNRGISLAME